MNATIANRINEIQKKQAKKLLAVCEITGITISIELPACTAVMEYRNPLADIKNILSILEDDKLLEMPSEILAGMLLAVLKRRNLIEGKLSAIEQNLLLQSVPAKNLIKAIIVIAKVTREQALLLGRYSIDSQLLVDEERKGFLLSSTLTNYITEVSTTLCPGIYLDSTRTTATTFTTSATTKIVKAKTVLTTEIKAEIRKLISILKEENVASPKLIDVLVLASKGENLLSLMAKDGLGMKVIAALERYQTPTSIELALTLKNIAKHLTPMDAVKQLFTKDLESVSDMSISKPRLSLREILAGKKQEQAVPVVELAVTVSDEEIDRLDSILTGEAPQDASQDTTEDTEDTEDTEENEPETTNINITMEEDETESLGEEEGEENDAI